MQSDVLFDCRIVGNFYGFLSILRRTHQRQTLEGIAQLTEKRSEIDIFPRANDKSAELLKQCCEKGCVFLKSKNDVLELDGTDFQILRQLEKDARLTYTDLGKMMGMAHSTVYDRIKRMENSGVIRKYTAILDTEKIGTKNITAIMTVYTDPKESEGVAEALAKAPETLDVYTSLSEELIIIAKVVSPDQESLHRFIANSVAPLAGVLRIRTSIATRKFKETQFSMFNDTKKLRLIKRSRN